uniref:Uncharacterized protein n=1 Tax=Picea sitchensis TaxID=3332 RepID=A0A6B9XX99_PICSI|nr:hypothetical protein Q903MT_gene6717 [Picea sitchensis]
MLPIYLYHLLHLTTYLRTCPKQPALHLLPIEKTFSTAFQTAFTDLPSHLL